MSSDAAGPATNGLLTSLSAPTYRRLRLERVPLEPHQVLYQPGQRIEHVYFPEKGCLISLILGLGDHRTFEVGVVGHEGVIGTEVFLGSPTGQFKAEVLAGGDAFRLRAALFRAELRNGSPLAPMVSHYVHFLLRQVSQVSACNRFHSLEQHFSSLLLRLQDQSGRADLEITHEWFARLIGVRRVGITQVAQKLQRARLIRYRWGKITILDREGLKACACECHQQIRRAHHELLGLPDGQL